jgi:hypothetical protein
MSGFESTGACGEDRWLNLMVCDAAGRKALKCREALAFPGLRTMPPIQVKPGILRWLQPRWGSADGPLSDLHQGKVSEVRGVYGPADPLLTPERDPEPSSHYPGRWPGSGNRSSRG